MIIRILGEGQYEVADAEVERLNELDAALDRALAEDDDSTYRSTLAALIEAVRTNGKPVDASTIRPSELVLPPEGASMSEVRQLLESEEVES